MLRLQILKLKFAKSQEKWCNEEEKAQGDGLLYCQKIKKRTRIPIGRYFITN